MKWGIIGAGNIANKFAKTVNSMRENNENECLIAIAARSKDRADTFAKKYKIEKAYDSYEQLFKDDEVEAVYVATPNNYHYEHCKQALLAGKNVLCEKPFTTNVTDAEKLYHLAEEKGLFIMEAFWISFLPLYEKVRNILNSGRLGEIKYARSDYGFIAKGARKIRKFDPSLGGGALLDIGIYNLGFMNMIFGHNPAEFTSDFHINEFGTDDYSHIQLKYGDDIFAAVTTSIGLDIPRNAVIVGTNGRIEFKDFQNATSMDVYLQDEEAETINVPFDYTGFEYEIREFSRCVSNKSKESEQYTRKASLETLKLMDEVRESWGMKFPYEK